MIDRASDQNMEDVRMLLDIKLKENKCVYFSMRVKGYAKDILAERSKVRLFHFKR